MKLNAKEKDILADIITRVLSGNISELDVKKLKGEENKFRVRKGTFRIIFKKDGGNIYVVSADRRNDNTYK